MLAVQPGGLLRADEELAAICVGPCMISTCHYWGCTALYVFGQVVVLFVLCRVLLKLITAMLCGYRSYAMHSGNASHCTARSVPAEAYVYELDIVLSGEPIREFGR